MEAGAGWRRGEGGPSVEELIEFAKRSNRSEGHAEHRERILQRVLARIEREREWRRLVHAFAAGASAVLLIGFLCLLVGG
jgi:hypothetical protein